MIQLFGIKFVKKFAGTSDVNHGGGRGDVAVGQYQHNVGVVSETVDESRKVFVSDLNTVKL